MFFDQLKVTNDGRDQELTAPDRSVSFTEHTSLVDLCIESVSLTGLSFKLAKGALPSR